MFKLKNYIILFIFIIISACEKDDSCLEAETPKLIIGFNDYYNQTEVKEVNNFSLIVLPVQDTIIKNSVVDSIALNLNVNENQTTFIFTNGTNNDTLRFSYIRKTIFVSKSCGYIMNFENLETNLIPDNDNWIKDLNVINNKIETDTVAHVKIFH